VELRSGDPSPTTLSLASGLALIEAVDAAVPGLALMLKWPNDLLLAGKKAAGILLERSEDRIVVGFGVNLASAPQIDDRPATTLATHLSPEAFAPLLAGSFARLLDLWRTHEATALVRAWEQRAHLPGTRLSVHVSRDETLAGRFAGVEPDGALRLMRDNGSIEVVRAGDVEL
jgi:BirA family biotin operon repressor/biotin-[acetyl-CoA-carboxylase] ligase